MELQFPAWRPGRYELGNFAKNIHGFRIENENGKRVEFKKITKDKWLVNCNGATDLKVYYKYFAAELNAGSTFMDDEQLYINPVNCLIYADDQQEEACEMAIEVPSNFQIACGAELKENTIYTSSYHQLVDTPFIASANLKHKTFEVWDVLFHIWIQGELEMEWERVINDFTAYTLKQFEKFGNLRKRESGFPVKEYHYLFQFPAVPTYHGVEHQDSTVIALGPAKDLMGKMYDEFLHISSHELYHSWNIKAIRPVEMYPYDYSKENYSPLGYVAEGVTTYLGDLFLVESQVKDFKWYKQTLEKAFQRHFDNFGRFNYSVAESSWDTWLDGYVAGAPNRKVSIYNEGAILALISDLNIRNGSENRASLHHVMRDLYENFALQNKGYTEVDYQRLIEEYSQEVLEDHFAHYYHGTHSYEPILVEALNQAGLDLKMKQNSDFAQAIVGIKTLEHNSKTIVSQIYPGSTAELGGLMLGDEVTQVNGQKIEQNLSKLIEQHQDDQLEFHILRKGRSLHIICPHTNKSYFPQYEIIKVKTPSNLNKRIFKKWCSFDWDTVEF